MKVRIVVGHSSCKYDKEVVVIFERKTTKISSMNNVISLLLAKPSKIHVHILIYHIRYKV